MSKERRIDQRLARPLDATWRGASGATKGRLGDISVGGCFVEARAMPTPGEATVVSVTIAGDPLTIEGEVVYVYPGMGFAVKWTNLTDHSRQQLAAYIRDLAEKD